MIEAGESLGPRGALGGASQRLGTLIQDALCTVLGLGWERLDLDLEDLQKH